MDEDLESEEEANVERQFNFLSELSTLVDYNVIEKYLYVIKNDSQSKKNPFLLQACTVFFRRIINQTKQTWIFFQIQTLSIFNKFIQSDTPNNQLMRGINEKTAYTQSERLYQTNALDLKSIVNIIVSKFTELLKKNHMLGVEALFRFPTREIKD